MRENFLHYIWQYKKFDVRSLKTTQREPIRLLSVGMHNHNSGPDFFNAKLEIEEQLWAGNVEIHLKTSDWYLHKHHLDDAYDNVILHVVYEHDTEVFRKDKSLIPTLELKPIINTSVLVRYYNLFSNSKKWINCENDFANTDVFVMNHWLERLYVERLEHKSKSIDVLLQESNNDWEAVLFKLLTRSFGLKVNTEAFEYMANSMDFSVVKKLRSDPLSLEALFFGQTGLLEQSIDGTYYSMLKKEYQFMKQKFQLTNKYLIPLQFFRLRPTSFPTIRLSQLANMYHQQPNLFSRIIDCKSVEEIYDLFQVATSPFWDTHYTFGKTSSSSIKRVSKTFIDVIIINTIIPLKFAFYQQKIDMTNHQFVTLIKSLQSEHNSIIKGFKSIGFESSSALESQALLQLKNEYCDKHQCLKCAIGNSLLNK